MRFGACCAPTAINQRAWHCNDRHIGPRARRPVCLVSCCHDPEPLSYQPVNSTRRRDQLPTRMDGPRVLILAGLVLGLVAVAIFLSAWLGPK